MQSEVEPNFLQRVCDIARPLYGGAYRAYHNWEHITYVMGAAFDIQRDLSPTTPGLTKAQVLAIAFHDCVYVPGSKLNEQMSAELMGILIERRENAALEVRPLDVGNAAGMVLATGEHFTNKTFNDEVNLVLDADLASLAQPYKDFCDSQRAIIFEHSHLPYNDVEKGQKDLLRKFLRKKRIYRSRQNEMILTWESLARKNIQAYVEE